MPQLWGIYVHVPFCLAKCRYCAFVSQAGAKDLQNPYVAALCSEIAAAGGDFDLTAMQVDTVFFGGGTPTVIPAPDLCRILQTLQRTFYFTAEAEISIEANPGTVSLAALQQLKTAGFNRLSVGVQSFDDAVLAAAGRIHQAGEAERVIQQARAAGFDNLSLDLMYGLPGQTTDSWRNTLAQAAEFRPDHISAYGLKLEEGTPLAADVAAGRVALPADDEEEYMYDLLNDYLPQRGYRRYEISNYALHGRECRHNLKYWRYLPYRGFGVAAHSFVKRERFANTENLPEYLRQVQAGVSPEAFREKLDRPTAMAEYIFLALRTAQGLEVAGFSAIFGCDFFQCFAAKTKKLLQSGLVHNDGEFLRLTPRGMKFGNQVFAEFLP